MKINWYVLSAGMLLQQSSPTVWPVADTGSQSENWFEVSEAVTDDLRRFLAPRDLHPLFLERCLAPRNDPSVVAYGQSLLLQIPAALDAANTAPGYLTLVFQDRALLTIRHAPLPELDDLIHSLVGDKAQRVQHLPQLAYLIFDCLSDRNVQSQIDVRDQILSMSRLLTEHPDTVDAADLAQLRWQVDKLVALIENQLYCVSGLNASDNQVLQDPHRKAYIQDLVAEAEIAQKAVYRLESRMNDLYAYYQMAGSDRVEKRLRVLTILSATTMPLGLIAGLLGMNVGGVPGTTLPYGFGIVTVAMLIIAAIELWYFKRRGWFD